MSLLKSVIRVTERSQRTCSLKYDGYSCFPFGRVVRHESSDNPTDRAGEYPCINTETGRARCLISQ
ncbi:hypothetical protein EXT64_02905 [Pectobacterium atrosepticum]|nr:hypothetical protein [Pectobacterium polaris]MCL6339614.1 hypothetical protein [Pectobacterium carotovorum subsp. carotovorum]MCL6343873.1 hypothetical protein [Pectobacterium carotovorum subsp. carotovorum]MCL6371875.1 hypothetical protein [Pectobacterium atrosepticum]MCL6397675.1 hypothetical protein [Pectobacterium carotovorum subsp. carotovorum]